MRLIEEEELEKVTGGGISVWAGVGIAAIVVFLAGVIEGITNPSRCHQ